MTQDSFISVSIQPVSTDRPRSDDRVVLIIEDDPAFSDMLAAQFRQAGYRPVRQYRGQDACAVAAILRPKLITLDIILHDLDGWNVLSELKRMPFMHNVPVLIISIVDEAESRGAFGPTGFLLKPSRRAELTDSILQMAPASHAPLRILVVDDEPLVGELSKSILTPPQFEVYVTRSARDAAEWLADPQHMPDLVLLDLVMPKTTGFEFLATLRSDSRTRHLPVLVWTAKHLSRQEQHELSQAAQVVLPKKHFSPARLAETLRYIERIQSFTALQSLSENEAREPVSDTDMSGFRDDFLKEAHEYLAHIGAWLGDEHPSDNADALQQVMRAAHTLKSAATIMEQPALGELAFEIETILRCILKQEAQLDTYALDRLHLLHQGMQEMIAVV
jgi:CheY-like chemotaxis protein